MGAPLKNPPVYLTVAQVRFNPILKLDDFLPNIQESFRQTGYPDFSRRQSIAIQLIEQEGKPPVPTPVTQARFEFGTVDKTHVFILDGQSLTLQSTNYGHFETFSDRFLDGLNIVHNAVDLAFTERIGLRYLDRVMPGEGETIQQYLAVEVHGLARRLAGHPVYAYSEAMNEVDGVKLISRVAIQTGDLAFPPDLQPGGMHIHEKFTSFSGESAILDNDGFVEGRAPFSGPSVAEHLTTIHKLIASAFKTTVTPFAFEAWDK